MELHEGICVYNDICHVESHGCGLGLEVILDTDEELSQGGFPKC